MPDPLGMAAALMFHSIENECTKVAGFKTTISHMEYCKGDANQPVNRIIVTYSICYKGELTNYLTESANKVAGFIGSNIQVTSYFGIPYLGGLVQYVFHSSTETWYLSKNTYGCGTTLPQVSVIYIKSYPGLGNMLGNSIWLSMIMIVMIFAMMFKG